MAASAHIGFSAVSVNQGEPEHRDRSEFPFLDIEEADQLAVAVQVLMNRIGVPMARAAAFLCDKRGWKEFGFATAMDFTREMLSRSGSWLAGMAQIGRGVNRWPRLAEALMGSDGKPVLNAIAAEWISKVADDATLKEWIDLARRVTVREVKERVRAAREAHTSSPRVEVSASVTEGDAEDDPEPDAATRIQVDLPVCPAFQESFRVHHELCEVLEGYRLSRNAAFENLCAEYLSGRGAMDPVPLPEEETGQVFFPRSPRRSRSSFTFSAFPEAAHGDELLAEAQRHLREAQSLLSKTEWPDAYEAGQDLKRLLDLEGELRRILAKLLTLIGIQSGWRSLGFRDLGHYANERLGISRTLAQDLVRINRFGGLHPKMAEAYESGKVGIRPAVLIIRALGFEADDEALERWLVEASTSTVKRLEDGLGWRRRNRILQKNTMDAPPDEETWRASISRKPGYYLARIEEYQTAAQADPEPTGWLHLSMTPGEAVFLSETLGAVQQEVNQEHPEKFPAEIYLERRGNSGRAFRRYSVHGITQEALFRLLLEFARVWDPPGKETSPRRRVIARDGYRCTVPGCTSRSHLESHHIVFRSRGGDEGENNQTTLCLQHHHMGVHGGRIHVNGSAPHDLRVQFNAGRRTCFYINEYPIRSVVTFFSELLKPGLVRDSGGGLRRPSGRE